MTVDVLLVGGGPATLGLLCNAAKTNRLHELVTCGDGIAVVEQGLSFGGGNLGQFGVNSNTSANGFIRGLYKRKDSVAPSPQKRKVVIPKVTETTEEEDDEEVNDDDDDDDDEEKEDEYDEEGGGGGGDADDWVEDDEENENNLGPKAEYVALNCFKDLYKYSPVV